MNSQNAEFLFRQTHHSAFTVHQLAAIATVAGAERNSTSIGEDGGQSYQDFYHCWSGGDSSSAQLLCSLSSVLGALSGVPTLVFVLIGMPGNALATWVLLRPASAKCRTRQSIYLGAGSAANCAAVLFCGLFQFFLPYGLPWLSGGSAGLVIGNVSDAACRSASFLMAWLILLAYGLLTAMVCDRTLAMYWPFRFQRLGTSAAYRVCGLVTIATVAMAAYLLAASRWIANPVTGTVSCIMYSYSGIELSSFSVFYDIGLGYPPVLLILTILAANAALLVRVLRIRQRRREMLRLQQTPGQAKTADSGVRSCTVCLAMSVALLSSSLPCATTSVLTYTLSAEPGSDLTRLETVILLCHISKMLIMLELSVSWLLLAWRSPEFQRNLVACLGCGVTGTVSGSGGTGSSFTTGFPLKSSTND